MRIALIALGYKPFRASGLDIAAERLVQLLLAAGHEVTLIAAQKEEIIEIHKHPSLRIYRIFMDRTNWIRYSYKATKLLNRLDGEQKFDVIHFFDIHFGFAYGGNFVASLQMSFRQRREMKKASVARYMYYWFAEHLMERPALAKAKGLLATSLSTEKEYKTHYGLSDERTALTRYGFDTDFFKPDPHRLESRSKLGISPEDLVIMFAGFVTPRKGIDYLARAMPLIRPTPRLMMVGKWDESYRNQFIKLLGDNSDRIIEAGYVPDDQMPLYYSMADVFVSPTLLEGFGFPSAEALCCCTPVVASDVSSIKEVVGPGGILVPPKDPIRLAQAISTLLGDKILREKMGQEGRAHVCREFDQSKMLHSTLEAYRKFLLS